MGYRHAAVLSAVGFLLGMHDPLHWQRLGNSRFLIIHLFALFTLYLISLFFSFRLGALAHTGVLFISFNADYRVLWQPLTDKAIDDAFYYYSTFYNAPKIVQVSG